MVTSTGAITTIAGTGAMGDGSGDDGSAAISVTLSAPWGVSVDISGNVYIAVTFNNKIRMVNSDGMITTIAGTGTAGYSGDGGAAISAELSYPAGIAVDISGNVYIADQNSNRIRMVSSDGIITTIAGTGAYGDSGDGGGAATFAQLSHPFGVAVDISGNVYIADSSNNKIRMVGPRGRAVALPSGQPSEQPSARPSLRPISQPSTQPSNEPSFQPGSQPSTRPMACPSSYPTAQPSSQPSEQPSQQPSARPESQPPSNQNIITTFAGTGIPGRSGDGGAAISAQLNYPSGVSVDISGNVYIVDEDNNKIRMVTKAGIITTIAGTGANGNGGDGGAATSAQLMDPSGVSVDISGNVYIVDAFNHKIRMVNSLSIINTFAGTGTAGDSGDSGLATIAQLNNPNGVSVDISGNVFIADTGNNKIRMVTSKGIITTIAGTGIWGNGGDGGLAIAAQLNQPYAVSVDISGNVYIADQNNNKIRMVTSIGIITTIAGTGAYGDSGDGGAATSATLGYPTGVSVDISGNVYIADNGNSKIRMVTSAGIITTIAGTGGWGSSGDGGAATSAQFYYPYGVSVDISGNVYIADYFDNKIRMIGPRGRVFSRPTGQPSEQPSARPSLLPTSQPSTQPSNEPSGQPSSQPSTRPMACPSSYPTAQPSSQPSEQPSQQPSARPESQPPSNQNIITTIAGTGTAGNSGDGGAAIAAQLNQPWDVSVDISGNVYIADGNNKIRRVTRAGIITTIAGTGDGGSDGDGDAATSAQLGGPSGVSVDISGNVYIADTGNHKIRMVTSTGIITTIAGTGMWGNSGDIGAATSVQLYFPSGVSVDISGNVYIADSSNNKIRMVNSNGIITTIAGTGTPGYSGDGGVATSAQLYNPIGVSVGISGNVYIADTYNHKIRMVNSAGIITTIAGMKGYGDSGDGGAATSAQLSGPFGVAVDISGNVYIADLNSNKIRIVTSAGIISTFAGTGEYGNSGDHRAATSAQFNYPYGVSVDISGKVYIADQGNNKIRMVVPQGQIVSLPTGQPTTQPSRLPTSIHDWNPSTNPPAGTVVDTETFNECTAGFQISGVRFCNGWTSYGNPDDIEPGTSVVYGVIIYPSADWSGIPQSYPAGLENAVFFNQVRGNYGIWDVSMDKTYSGVTAFTQYYLQFWMTSQNTGVPSTFTVSLGGSVVYSTLPQHYVWSQATTASVCAPSSSLVAQFHATANGVPSAMAVAGISLVAGSRCTIQQQPSPQPITPPPPPTQVEQTNITVSIPMNMI